ncbi:MAG: flagellar export protein FliJ [Candidatus Dadabacteria bacterium]|nr:MAG: flagellar export protein FliJ [Candidatus Dadabacteria bacterium]
MKRFKFRLERILQYRTALKNEKLRELAMKNHALNENIAILEELQAAELLNRFEAGKTSDASDVLLMGMYAGRLIEQIDQQREKIKECQKERDAALEEYVEAAKDAESLEKLKQRKKREYQEYVDKEELKFLDELATQRGNTFQHREMQ